MNEQLNLYLNIGIPISIEYLMLLLLQHVICGILFDVMLKSSRTPAQKHSQKWLRYAFLKSSFVYQMESISQKIPVDLCLLAEA